MRRIVVDASAIMAVLLREAHRDVVVEATRGVDLLSPDSLPFEIANALSARMKRRDEQRIDAAVASEAFSQFRQMEIALLPQRMSDHVRALELAGQLGLYAYDAYILAAARKQKAPLLTLDGMGRKQGLLQQAPKCGVSVVELEG